MNKAQAINHFGSISALAKVLKVTYEAVRQWEEVPELRQYQLERLTEGSLRAEALPTLNQKIRPISPADQSSDGAGVLYSAKQATA